MLEIVVGLLIGVLGLAYLHVRKVFTSWQKLGVQVPSYNSFLGHTQDLMMKPERWEYIDKLYYQFKDLPYFGFYEVLNPCLCLRDRDLIRDVLVKEADSFVDRRDIPFRPKYSTADAIFAEMVLHKKGENWKNLRSLMSPTFTSGKIKAMFPSISRKADQLLSFLDQKLEEDPVVEVRKPLGQYTLGVISSCAFGLETDFSDESSEFSVQAEKFASFSLWVKIRFLIVSVLPDFILNLFGFGFLATDDLKYYENVVTQTITERKKKNIRRDDFLDLMEDCLEESSKSDNEKYKITNRSVIAQSLLFILAGYDTTSNGLSAFCFLLGKNQDSQDKLREELRQILETDGELNYKNVMEAKYLDACVSESLRMYGPAHFLERKCTADFKFEKTGLVVKQGTFVVVPSWSFHYDEQYWDEPRAFKPERFLPENKDNIVPFTYFPFGSGPRNCIGMRFALLELKLVISKMILKYRLTVPDSDPKLIFNKDDPFTLRLSSNGVRIHMEKL